jgi:hypothetical protein
MLLSTLATDFTFALFFDRSTKSPYGLITVDNEQYFVNNGVFTTGLVGSLGQVSLGSEKSTNINSERGFLGGLFDTSKEDKYFMVHNELKKEIWFYLPVTTSADFNNIYIYDYVNKIWFLRKSTQKIVDATYYNNYVYSVTSEGELLKEEFGNTFNTVDITWLFASQYFNFGDNISNKDIDEVWLDLDNAIDNNFIFSTRFNYDPLSISSDQPINIEDGTTLVWDDLEDEWDVEEFATELPSQVPVYVYNGNISTQLRLYGTDNSHNFALSGIKFLGVLKDM